MFVKNNFKYISNVKLITNKQKNNKYIVVLEQTNQQNKKNLMARIVEAPNFDPIDTSVDFNRAILGIGTDKIK